MRINKVTAILFSLLFSSFVCASQYKNLAQYATPNSVVNIFNDKVISTDVKNLTKSNYNQFIGNYQAFADPVKVTDGGLLVDGWLNELRLENASAMVIEPDGRLYLAWVVPGNSRVMYLTNDKNMSGIQPDIRQWASRFEHVSFDEKKQQSAVVDVVPRVSYFESKNYKVKIMLTCADSTQVCNKALYQGTSKSDGKKTAVMGQVIRTHCDSMVCHCEWLSV
ncbi:hypothetical protein EHW64_20450 [Erwinia psidii]|uniref:hypothetical protein n=1 Tax=Erwinia psidii TaxID=69224 RepID=UPI00226B6846|nr:hypothetical protein [Erwinia psidii]MCX8963410.1 hypothetical protein [Erwinia psidii]